MGDELQREKVQSSRENEGVTMESRLPFLLPPIYTLVLCGKSFIDKIELSNSGVGVAGNGGGGTESGSF